MQTVGEIFAILPMPFVWLLLIGLALWSRPAASRRVFAVTAVAVSLSSLAVVGKVVLLAFLSTVPVWEQQGAPGPVAIIVPTAGIFSDENGKWYASSSSIHRAATGLRLREKLKVPLILSGGAPVGGQPPEAQVIADELGLHGPGIILESTARNSQETAQAVAGLLKNFPQGPVLLVTSDMHVARMGAVLRHAGLSVVQTPDRREAMKQLSWTDFVPSTLGLAYSAQLSREYWSILWYLVSGRLSFSDLACRC